MSVIIGAGGPSDKKSIQLATRRGTFIENEQRMERHPESLKAARDIWKEARPMAEPRSFSSVYNCLGLVFSSRRTWIDPKQLSLILREDEYRRVFSLNDVREGDVVVYRHSVGNEVKHVGVIVDRSLDAGSATWKFKVLSQWGGDGEYYHEAEYVPVIFGRPSEYWTDRRELS